MSAAYIGGYLRGFWEYRSSAFALMAANLLTLLGAIILRWDAFAIVALYWAENVVIGAINILKMITCSPEPAEVDWSEVGSEDNSPEMSATLGKLRRGAPGGKLNHHTSKVFFVPFFALHYGLFCFVHGVFIIAILAPHGVSRSFSARGLLVDMIDLFSTEHLWWWVALLAASHLYSFFVNYLGHGEFRRTVVPALIFQPYTRIVLLHIALLFGGWIAMTSGSNVGVLTILIAGKTLVDLHLHLLERRRNAGNTSNT